MKNTATGGLMILIWLSFLTGVCALNTALAVQGALTGPERERPIGIRDAEGRMNPHSDLIFRATGARSCGDCHEIGRGGDLITQPMDNDLVRTLRDKAKGIHGPGRFADCLRCHAGGRKGVEKY